MRDLRDPLRPNVMLYLHRPTYAKMMCETSTVPLRRNVMRPPLPTLRQNVNARPPLPTLRQSVMRVLHCPLRLNVMIPPRPPYAKRGITICSAQGSTMLPIIRTWQKIVCLTHTHTRRKGTNVYILFKNITYPVEIQTRSNLASWPTLRIFGLVLTSCHQNALFSPCPSGRIVVVVVDSSN
jgi:hypothetical protein